jgi:hypothetical protein
MFLFYSAWFQACTPAPYCTRTNTVLDKRFASKKHRTDYSYLVLFLHSLIIFRTTTVINVKLHCSINIKSRPSKQTKAMTN